MRLQRLQPADDFLNSEIEREANIARNRALLEQLELKQAVENLEVPKHKGTAKSTAKPVQPAKRVKRERLEPEAPRRQSARLKKDTFDPDESPSKRQKREVCFIIDFSYEVINIFI